MWVVAVLFGGPPFAIAYWQYTATFRARQSSANVLRYVLLLVGAGAIAFPGLLMSQLVLGGAMTASEFITHLTLPFVVPGVLLCGMGFLNFRWHRRLSAAPILATAADGDLVTPTAWLQLGPKQLLAFAAALIVVAAGAAAGYRDIPPQMAMHVSPSEARLLLPPGASDVCIQRSSRGIISYNFAIDEAGFWEWTKLDSTQGSPESRQSGVKILPVTRQFKIHDPFAEYGTHTISRGWFYDFHVEDRGHKYAYDADEGRAYFDFHSY